MLKDIVNIQKSKENKYTVHEFLQCEHSHITTIQHRWSDWRSTPTLSWKYSFLLTFSKIKEVTIIHVRSYLLTFIVLEVLLTCIIVTSFIYSFIICLYYQTPYCCLFRILYECNSMYPFVSGFAKDYVYEISSVLFILSLSLSLWIYHISFCRQTLGFNPIFSYYQYCSWYINTCISVGDKSENCEVIVGRHILVCLIQSWLLPIVLV